MITDAEYVAAVACLIRTDDSRGEDYCRDIMFSDFASVDLSSIVWC